MTVYIHCIETALPRTRYDQSFARDRMKSWVEGKRAQRLVHQVYNHSGIETRHSVVDDFVPGATPRLFRTQPDGRLDEPGTAARNKLYTSASKDLSTDVARRAVSHAPSTRPEDITHVITVSCTGFCNPGPDYHIVRALGLAESTERYHIGFMGCYAAFPALRMAQQFCFANPRAVVLVVSVELCSLHLQVKTDLDSLLANALFADGAAAVLVSAREPAPGTRALRLDGFSSALVPSGEEHMAWEIGDHGFDITLSSYVPKLLGANIGALVDRLLVGQQAGRDDIGPWAIHPGGKAILDRIEEGLGLQPAQIHASREVLRDYGNMSSATILFVLRRLLDGDQLNEENRLCAMAFGPGLTVELGLFRLARQAVSETALRRGSAKDQDTIRATRIS